MPPAWLVYAYYIVMFALVAYGMTRSGPKIPDATVQTGDSPTAQEGRPIPVVFGTVFIRDPNFYYFGGLRTMPIVSSGGGKK